MQESVRNSLITLTTIGTILGIYFKAVDGFIINLVKIRYKNIPGKKSMFNIVIELLGYIFISIYLLMCIVLIFNIIFFRSNGGWNLTKNIFNLHSVEPVEIIAILFLVCFSGALAFTYILFSFIMPMFKTKLIDKKVDIKSKYFKFFNFLGIIMVIISIAIESMLIYILTKDGIKVVRSNGIYIFENNISDGNMYSLVFFIVLMFISITSCLVLNSIRQIYKEVCSEDMYTLITNNERVSTRCYLEYDEFYLNIEDGIEYYIKKSDVREIIKMRVPYN